VVEYYERQWRHPEYQYLDLVRDIIANGDRRGDRTGVGTVAVFGRTMRFDLAHGFPLLTTKRVFWRGVLEELLWFIAGSTDARKLSAKGVRIWDGNGSREYLDSVGLSHRREGDLGPVYGFQWRFFGAEYIGCETQYKGQGIDQIAQVIDKIKNRPTDRRMIVSAWNPSDLSKMALPPCHMMCQFFVRDGKLSCQMIQRSVDTALGLPFNIASYSLLTCMIASVCGLEPGEFIIVMGDTHVYTNHVEPLKEQLERTPRAFPRLWINPEVKDIDAFTAEDIKIEGYNPHATIKMEMAV
jgi:dihydrofolate reductase/thymidylate synthase